MFLWGQVNFFLFFGACLVLLSKAVGHVSMGPGFGNDYSSTKLPAKSGTIDYLIFD